MRPPPKLQLMNNSGMDVWSQRLSIYSLVFHPQKKKSKNQSICTVLCLLFLRENKTYSVVQKGWKHSAASACSPLPTTAIHKGLHFCCPQGLVWANVPSMVSVAHPNITVDNNWLSLSAWPNFISWLNYSLNNHTDETTNGSNVTIRYRNAALSLHMNGNFENPNKFVFSSIHAN